MFLGGRERLHSEQMDQRSMMKKLFCEDSRYKFSQKSYIFAPYYDR